MVAEFESDLIRARTREGMQVAKAKGHLRGKQPKLSPAQQRHLMEVHLAGTHSTAELAELLNVARSTVYRTVQRQSVDHTTTLAGSRCRANDPATGKPELQIDGHAIRRSSRPRGVSLVLAVWHESERMNKSKTPAV